MIYFILLVSIIVLVDFSGKYLDKDLEALIYSTDLEQQDNEIDTNKENTNEDLTVEQIAQQAEEFIYSGLKSEKDTK